MLDIGVCWCRLTRSLTHSGAKGENCYQLVSFRISLLQFLAFTCELKCYLRFAKLKRSLRTSIILIKALIVSP
jgi:hypothetical protein